MEAIPLSRPEGSAVNTLLQELRGPRVHLRDVVETYMQSYRSGLDGSLHPALNTNDPRVKLDPDRHKWVETEIEEVGLKSQFEGVAAEQNQFLIAMADYDSQVGSEYKVGINMNKHHSIGDVIKAIDDAKKVYDKKEEGHIFGPIRKAFRKLGDHEGTVKTWLSVPPGESEYFSIICGGIQLILGAAARLREINNAISNAMVKIPDMLQQSQRTINVHNKSEALRNWSSKLYVAVLHAMRHILRYYQQRATSKVPKALVSQGTFEKTLLDKIDAIVQCRDALDEEAKSCDRELSKETKQLAKKVELVGEASYEKIGFIQESIATMRFNAQKDGASIQQLRQQVENMAKIQAKALNFAKDVFMKNAQLSEALYKKGHPAQEATPTKSKYSSNFDTRHTAPKRLLSRLEYDKDSPRDDMRANLRHAMSMSLEDQDRAVFMMQSELLQSWLTSAKSSALLVNGGAYNFGSQKSPLSFVCAKLSHALRQARRSGSPASKSLFIDLNFFCGEHDSWRENADNGPAGALNSLLAQLLTRYQQFDLKQVRRIKKLEPDDVIALSEIFGDLLDQLPSPIIVFCIIDNLQCYADERKEDAEIMLSDLISLTRKLEEHCIFKLLVTAPIDLGLDAVYDLDRDREILTIPEGLEKGGGFTEMKWDVGLGEDIDVRYK